MGYSGMSVWGATPEPKHYFLALCSSNTTIIGIQKRFCWPMRYCGIGVWGAGPQPKQYFWHCVVQTVQTPPSRVSKNTFAGLWGAAVWVFGAELVLALSSSNTTITGIQKHLCWPMGYSGMGVWDPSPQPKQYFWHCAIQTPPS